MEEPPLVTAFVSCCEEQPVSLQRKCKDDLSEYHFLGGKAWGGGGQNLLLHCEDENSPKSRSFWGSVVHSFL